MNVHNEDLYKIPMEELFGKPKAVVAETAVAKSTKEVKMMKEMEAKKETIKKSRHTMASL
jgi:hypothetical protein